jgi:hypothetical protein
LPSYNRGALAHTHSDHYGIKHTRFRGGGIAYRNPVRTHAHTDSSHAQSYIHTSDAHGTARDRLAQSQPAAAC